MNSSSRKKRRGLFPLSVLLLTIVVYASCTRSRNPNIQMGSSYLYKEGYPEIRVAAIGLFDEQGNPGIDVATDVVYQSLVWRKIDSLYTAGFTMDIRIAPEKSDTSGEGSAHTFTYTIRKKNARIIHSPDTYSIWKRFAVKPGKYTVQVAVMDNSSNKQAIRTAKAELPLPNEKVTTLTNVLLLGRDLQNKTKNTFFPVTTYDVPGKIDTLRFEYQVNKPTAGNSIQLHMQLIKFASDSMPPRMMAAPMPSPSSIQYKGIDYGDKTIIEEQKRTLTSEMGNILIQYPVPRPPRGNYRFQITMSGKGASDTDFKARDFGVRSPDYPYVETVRELAAPLYYLMDKKEYKKLMDFHDPDSMKHFMDAFWLNHIKDENTAKEVIKLYYKHVEEANMQFGNYKAGWKTDPGMIYILFGPPYYVYRSLNHMQWTYGYDRSDPLRNFYFTEPKIPNEYFPFDNYILQRQNYYFTVRYQRVQDWLNGYVLKYDF